MRLLPWLILCVTGCGSSLHVNLVDAAHRKPSNVAVYFSVDTDDGNPVAGLSAEDFEIHEDGSRVSIHESRQTIVNPELTAAHYTLLLVDMSGSVSESPDLPLIAQAARQFTTELDGHQRVGVYAFDGSEDIRKIQGFSPAKRTERTLKRLEEFRTRDPSTNLNGAVVKALAELEAALDKEKAPLRFGTLVVFTDGTDHRAGADPRAGTDTDFIVLMFVVPQRLPVHSAFPVLMATTKDLHPVGQHDIVPQFGVPDGTESTDVHAIADGCLWLTE